MNSTYQKIALLNIARFRNECAERGITISNFETLYAISQLSNHTEGMKDRLIVQEKNTPNRSVLRMKPENAPGGAQPFSLQQMPFGGALKGGAFRIKPWII